MKLSVCFYIYNMDIYDLVTLVVIVTLFKYTLDLNFPTTMVILMILCYDFLSINDITGPQNVDPLSANVDGGSDDVQ